MSDTKNERGTSLGQLLIILAIAAFVCAGAYDIYNNFEHTGRPIQIKDILSYQSEADTIDNQTTPENPPDVGISNM